ncbi:uncharacterized protein LOC126267924 [Schistocerca gregaria]|uniref:uncharacterized protein LOC126267924 n=1 Tax=Schistocerca gregaria TaxID=7010 RepID=UPI00211E7DF5|nr:uncharacterized protein LOC126267924 [Schistocerca gregaria]
MWRRKDTNAKLSQTRRCMKENRDGMRIAQPWSKLRKAKIPQLLSLKESYLTVVEEQTEPLHMNITCVLPSQVHFWLIFTNPSVGDFIIKLDITPTLATPQEFIGEVAVASHCSCQIEQPQENSACPRTVAMQIPCCNHSLWFAAAEILRNTLEHHEFEFWIQFTETRVGLLLLNWFIGQEANSAYKELSPIFNTNVTYNITSSATKYVKVQHEVTVKDTLSKGVVRLPIHIEEGAPNPLTFSLTMTSKDECEIRTYQVCIREIQSDHDLFDEPTLKQLSKAKSINHDIKSKHASGKSISRHRN